MEHSIKLWSSKVKITKGAVFWGKGYVPFEKCTFDKSTFIITKGRFTLS